MTSQDTAPYLEPYRRVAIGIAVAVAALPAVIRYSYYDQLLVARPYDLFALLGGIVALLIIVELKEADDVRRALVRSLSIGLFFGSLLGPLSLFHKWVTVTEAASTGFVAARASFAELAVVTAPSAVTAVIGFFGWCCPDVITDHGRLFRIFGTALTMLCLVVAAMLWIGAWDIAYAFNAPKVDVHKIRLVAYFLMTIGAFGATLMFAPPKYHLAGIVAALGVAIIAGVASPEAKQLQVADSNSHTYRVASVDWSGRYLTYGEPRLSRELKRGMKVIIDNSMRLKAHPPGPETKVLPLYSVPPSSE